MIVTTLAPPAAEPVSLAETKDFLRIAGTGEDELVASIIAGARARVEEAVGLALITRTLRVALDAWPVAMISRRSMTLPVRPAGDLVAVRVTQGGALLTMTETFNLAAGRSARLSWISGALPRPDPQTRIEIDYAAGFGEAASDVAESLRLAVKQLAAYAYQSRGYDGHGGPLPADVAALVAPWRRVRL